MKTGYAFVITLLTLGFILSGAVAAQEDARALDWRDIPFQDVLTGETIRISDFEGKPDHPGELRGLVPHLQEPAGSDPATAPVGW